MLQSVCSICGHKSDFFIQSMIKSDKRASLALDRSNRLYGHVGCRHDPGSYWLSTQATCGRIVFRASLQALAILRGPILSVFPTGHIMAKTAHGQGN
jgi:hypothetical protein